MNEEAQPTLLYLEADDEITAVVRRVRAADAGRVIIVAPGRSRATSSAVALRLLAGEERDIAVVGDALTRSLAAEAGLTAYTTVEDARRAEPARPDDDAPRHAAIHVVRGSATDETAPTLAAGAAAVSTVSAASDAPTAAVPVARPAPARAPRAVPGRSRPRVVRRAFPAVLVGALALLLVSGVVAGAILLPSAQVVVTPRSEPISPQTYQVVVSDPERLTGTVEAKATVTPTGSYAIQQQAVGTVVFRNFNVGPVEIPAETQVAAADVVFVTVEAVVAPPGSLTDEGTIAGGEAVAPIVAANVGTAGNVPANAIDTILDEGTRNRLRLFPQNQARLVLNPEPTTGGVDTGGTEFLQADVDAAVAALREDLVAAAAAAAPEGDDDSLVVQPTETGEPTIEGTDGIVGTRDQEAAEISGSLGWVAYRVDTEVVRERAEAQFTDDPDVLPDGHQLLPEATAVTLGPARLDGETVVVEARVSGASAPELDPESVRARVIGRTPEEAQLALVDLGTARVELWPAWVATVPELEWRVEVRIEELDVTSPLPSQGAEPSP